MTVSDQRVPTLDLQRFCRDADQIYTEIKLFYNGSYGPTFPWIKLGQTRLRLSRKDHDHGGWLLAAYLGHHSDDEHDSAFVLQLPIIGVNFIGIEYGQTILTGYIDPNLRPDQDFRVPPADYDPLAGAPECEYCAEHREEDGVQQHLIVPYLPPANPDLYRLVRGLPVYIATGVVDP